MLDELYCNEHELERVTDELFRKMTSGRLTEAEFNSEYSQSYQLRRKLSKHSWIVITKEWLDSLERLTKGKHVLEVCAGSGWVTKLMNKRRGCKWTATDKVVGKNNQYEMFSQKWVVEMEAMDAVSRFKPDIIFASWIPYESELDCELGDLGLPMILVGEGWGGCTGSEKFWHKHGKKIIEPNAKFDWFTDIPQWYGLHDYTSLVHWDVSSAADISDFCVCSKPDLMKNIADGKDFKYCRSCKKERA